MIAASTLLCAVLAQATPPAPPTPPVPPRPPERRLHLPRVHVPPIEVPGFDLDMEDLDFSGLDLSGLRAGLERMHDDDDEDDDDEAQEARDRAREERDRQRERVREQAEKIRQRVREQQERAREQQERAREQQEQARDRAREQQDRFREQEDRSREERRRFRYNFRFGEEDDDEGVEMDPNLPSTHAKGKNGVATLPAKGPVTVRIRAQSGEVQMVTSDRGQVSATLSDVTSKDEIQLAQSGDRVYVQVGRKALRRGKLRIEAPKGSSLDFESTSADVQVQGTLGDVRVRTMSGDVKMSGVRKADVETISGDVTVDASGPVRLHTVSGNVVASTADPGVRFEFESASGNLDWTGACGKGCRVSTETVSGQIAMAVDSRSSFELSYSSHSGDFRNDLNLDVKRAPKKKHGGMGGWLEAVYGKGEGVIECDAFSGDLQIRKK
jgi:DUF4097 and DUF4098 domain-containing protein YvlB